MQIFDNRDEMIPEGTYPVKASNMVDLTTDPRCNGADAIQLYLFIQVQPDAEGVAREHTEVIDKRIPARGSAKKSPYQFMCGTLQGLGVKEDDIEPALYEGISQYAADAETTRFAIPGLGSAEDARVKVTHVQLNRGGWTENYQIQWAGLSPKRASSLLATFNAPKSGSTRPMPGAPTPAVRTTFSAPAPARPQPAMTAPVVLEDDSFDPAKLSAPTPAEEPPPVEPAGSSGNGGSSGGGKKKKGGAANVNAE